MICCLSFLASSYITTISGDTTTSESKHLIASYTFSLALQEDVGVGEGDL